MAFRFSSSILTKNLFFWITLSKKYRLCFVNKNVDICDTFQCLQFFRTDHRCLRTGHLCKRILRFSCHWIFVETKMASQILKRILISSRSVPAILPVASRSISRSAAALAPQVQHPAPTFKTQAVVNGAFKEISLEVSLFWLDNIDKRHDMSYDGSRNFQI